MAVGGYSESPAISPAAHRLLSAPSAETGCFSYSWKRCVLPWRVLPLGLLSQEDGSRSLGTVWGHHISAWGCPSPATLGLSLQELSPGVSEGLV